jgi:Transposase DNA-binding/Transposase Tn5 dimerisation domain
MQVTENAEWAREQFESCEFGDKRRTERVCKMAINMLERPEGSLVAQNENWKDVKAAYTWCAREEVTFDAVATPHWEQTRLTKPGRYLLISDTTDIDHFHHKATTGLSQLGDGRGQGMQLHSCLVVDAEEKVVLGTAGALLNYRPKASKKESRTARLKRRRESEIWGDVVAQAGAPPAGSQWIHVFDRGGDNFEAMIHIVQNRGDFIIRAAKLQRNVIDEQGKKRPFREVLGDAKVLGHYKLSLRARPGQKARVAKIEVSTLRIEFPQPHFKSKLVKNCGLKSIAMNVVVVQETNPPKGVTPVRWILLTSLPVDTFEQVWEVIEFYECRWLIEEYHKVLKTGCAIERHALREASRLEPLIALISVIGVRLLQLKTITRKNPDQPAKARVPGSWLKALKALRPRLKTTTLTVYEFFRELAKLGGFLGRKHDGEPGWQTIWRGYQKLQGILLGMKIANKKFG